jgi:ribosomal protein L7/L12
VHYIGMPDLDRHVERSIALDRPLPLHKLLLELLCSIVTIREWLRKAAEKVMFEVVLLAIDNRDQRIDVVREIRQATKLPLEQCRAITKSTPSSVFAYESYEQAQQLQRLLERHDCRVEIITP